MKHVGVREFRDNATRYLAGDEVIAVERHGHPIGIYVPTTQNVPTDKRRSEAVQEALVNLKRVIEEVLDKTGMTENELADLFDLNVPIEDALAAAAAAKQRASRS